jgi:hypothetical protein
MARDRDTGPAAAQDKILNKVEPSRLRLVKRSETKRPQNPALAGREKKILMRLKIIERGGLNF